MPVNPTQNVLLAHYYGYKQFIKVDSAKVDENGLLTFENKDNNWKGGIYLIVTSSSKYYDFIYSGNENNITITFDTTDYINTVKFENSPENDYLFSYRKFLDKESKKAAGLQEKLKTESDLAKITEIRNTLNGLQKEIDKDIRNRAAQKPEFFASKIMLANLEPELPDQPPLLPNGRPDSTYFFRTYKAHFFDHLDFSDERLIRTPFLESKVEKYFNNLVYQRTDSLKKDLDFVLNKASQDKDVYRYVLWYVTNKYENTDIVGLDGVVVHLYKNHYLKNGDWLDDSQRKRFTERLATIEPLETGKVMPQLILKDLEGKTHNLNEVKANFTLVYFYSPTCGHCKDAAPSLVKYQNENLDKGIVVWNVASDPARDENEIRKFIKDYKMEGIMNLYDPDHQYDFYYAFDVYSTPTLYILDEQKRIIGKRIPIEEINGYIDYYEKNMKGRL